VKTLAEQVRRAENALLILEKALLVLLLSVMVGMSFFQVALRQLFSTSLLWGDIFLRHLVLWVGFLGATIAVVQNKHFIIDPVRNLFRGAARTAAAALANAFSVATLILLSGAALRFLRDDRSSGSVLFTVGETAVPSFWMNAAIPAGFILLTAHFALKLVEQLLDPDSIPGKEKL
jgi:TRAP-type C4-dicarboxylate transport system permease small subunit